MAATYLFEILTPQKTIYSGRISSLVGPGTNGFFGVLANHAPLVAESSGGKLKIREESQTERQFEVGPGFFEVLKNRVILLTKKADKIGPDT